MRNIILPAFFLFCLFACKPENAVSCGTGCGGAALVGNWWMAVPFVRVGVDTTMFDYTMKIEADGKLFVRFVKVGPPSEIYNEAFGNWSSQGDSLVLSGTTCKGRNSTTGVLETTACETSSFHFRVVQDTLWLSDSDPAAQIKNSTFFRR
jgi:hypothetical protein